MTAERHRRVVRRALILLIGLVAVMAFSRAILDPVATHLTRKGLAGLGGYRSELGGVHVTIFSPGCTITRLKIWDDPGGSPEAPLFYADRVHVALAWRALLHGRLAVQARIEDPKVIVVRDGATRLDSAPDLSSQLEHAMAFKIDRIEALRAEVLFRDLVAPGHTELWLHKMDLAAENLATRPGLVRGRPATLNAHGTLGRSGDVTLFVSANLFARPLSFAGRFAVRGFRAAELYEMVAPKTELQLKEGTIDLFAEFISREGEITGGIKPVLKNVSIAAAAPGLGKRIEAWASNTTIHLLSDSVPGRNSVATVVPIKGRLVDPEAQLWPTLFGVIRNAFVEGLASGFAHLPPATAAEPESVLQQATAALDKSKDPPKAQPQDRPKNAKPRGGAHEAQKRD